jgi:tetratricopeptide (TPR) repeat protein
VPKIGRNDPCPCASGKKYKHCCLEKDRQAESAQLHMTAQAREAQLQEYQAALMQADALDVESNTVVDLVNAGRLQEAEQAARELLVRYPEVPDGHDRLGMVHEARGEFHQAADCYRQVIEFTRANPQDYDTGYVDMFLERIAKLEAAADAGRAANEDDHG